MNNRIWLGLLLLIFSMLGPIGTATAEDDKKSHRDLPGGLDLANPEEMMAQRLQELHQLHQLQDQVQDLLHDPKFRDQLGNFKEEDWQRLQQKMTDGKGLKGDGRWEEFLQKAADQHKWDARTKDMLRRLVERNEPKPPAANGSDNLIQGRGSDSSPSASKDSNPPVPTPSPQPTAPPEPSSFEQMQMETTKWMLENFDTVGGDILEALAESKGLDDNSPLAELFRSIQHPDFSTLNVSDRAIGLSHYLSDAGDFLHEHRGPWDEMRSLFLKAPTPSLPSFDGPSVSLPAASGMGGGSWAPAFLSLLLLGLVVLLLALRSLGAKARSDGDGDGWRLGSWPVSPGRVTTRQDVIRAFEYLALLCLGPAASVHHHRELAQRLAEQDSGNLPRRNAAEMLAWVYEQARYAPDGEALSPDQLSDARRALVLLAGVTAP